MADVTTVAGPNGTLMDVTVMYNQGATGYSETLHAYVVSANPYEALKAPMQRYIETRLTILSNKAAAVAIRISKHGVFGDADTQFSPENGMGPGELATDPTEPKVAWSMRMEDDTNQVHATTWYHGLTVENAVFSGAGTRVANNPTKVIRSWRSSLEEFLTPLNGKPKDPGIYWVIPTYNRDKTISKEFDLVGTGLDTQGRIQFVLTTAGISDTDLALFKAGKAVKLTAEKKKPLKGISSMTRLVNVTTDPALYTLTFNKKPATGATAIAGLSGKVQFRVPMMAMINEVRIEGLTTHKVGRAFFGPVGRRSGCNC